MVVLGVSGVGRALQATLTETGRGGESAGEEVCVGGQRWGRFYQVSCDLRWRAAGPFVGDAWSLAQRFVARAVLDLMQKLWVASTVSAGKTVAVYHG